MFDKVKRFLGLVPDAYTASYLNSLSPIQGMEMHVGNKQGAEQQAYRAICRMVNIGDFLEKKNIHEVNVDTYLESFTKAKGHLLILGISPPQTLEELRVLKGKLLFDMEKANG